jgi:hypothetical protein
MYDYIGITSYINNQNGGWAEFLSRWGPGEEPDAPLFLAFFVLEVEPDTTITGFEKRDVNLNGIADHLGQGTFAMGKLKFF